MPKRRRPKSITMVALVVMIIAITNLVRAVQAIAQWQFLSAVLSCAPYYQLVTGIIWGFNGIWLFCSLWFGWRNSPVFMIVGTITFSIYLWIDRLAFSSAPFDSNWLFILIINGICLIYIIWLFRQKYTKTYFGATYDSRSQD